MSHYERAEAYLESAERVREKMVALEEANGKLDYVQLDHAVQAIRNFGILAQAHAELAMIDAMRARDGVQ